MKKVVSESEVAHLWANQLQDEARKANASFYFEGRTIYSYGKHFPIAVIDKENSNVVFFTTRTYSVATSGHISTVSGACKHKTKIYCKNPDQADQKYHSENIADFEAKAKEQAFKLAKAKKPEIYLTSIAQQRHKLEEYCKYFFIDITNQYDLIYIWIESKDSGNKATELELIAIKKREEERIAYQKKEHTRQLRKFKSFKWDQMSLHNGQDYLRFNKETNRIETSQRVQIPLGVAQKFYKHIIATIKKGGCTECPSKLMNYQVKQINKDFISIGCHTITMVEIKKIAKLLNW